MCPSESEGFHLNSHSGDWWGKPAVYSSLPEVVFLVCKCGLWKDTQSYKIAGFSFCYNMSNVFLISQVWNLYKYLCEESNELLTYTYIVI